jgi:hypothetical protein
MSADSPRSPDRGTLSNDSQSYNDQSEGSEPRGEVEEPRDEPDRDDAGPMCSESRRKSLGEPRPGTSSSELLDGIDEEEEEENSSRNLEGETCDSDVERPGFRFNLITRRRDFIQTTDQPEAEAKMRETAAAIMDRIRQERSPPQSKSCILL